MYEVAEHNKVRHDVVDNFLITVDASLSHRDHLHNLSMDAYRYGWNNATRRAIEAGLRKIYGEFVFI